MWAPRGPHSSLSTTDGRRGGMRGRQMPVGFPCMEIFVKMLKYFQSSWWRAPHSSPQCLHCLSPRGPGAPSPRRGINSAHGDRMGASSFLTQSLRVCPDCTHSGKISILNIKYCLIVSPLQITKVKGATQGRGIRKT